MDLDRIQNGLVMTTIGVVLIITFNQKVMELISFLTTELQVLAGLGFVFLLFYIGMLLPIGASVSDTKQM